MWNEVSTGQWALIADDVAGVVNNGLMVLHIVAGATVNADGFRETDFDNSGQIYIVNEGTGGATAVNSFVGGSFFNNGLVAVQALHGIACGYLTNNESTLDNRAGGQILVEGMGAIAFATSNGSWATPTAISNAGTIRAVSLDPGQLSVGLWLAGMSDQRFDVTNSGTISADVAIYGADDTGTVIGNVVHQVHNVAGGRIDGLIYLQRGNDNVDNAGIINGNVVMGDGADIVDTRAGTINGVTDLGWGSDIYKGGNAVDLVAAGRDDDNLDGGAGNDQLMGGGGDDVLVGGAGNDGLFGEFGNDRIVTAGGDYVDGGDGNDRIELGDYTFEHVSGGAGFDTLVLAGGTRTFNLASALAEAAFADFEQVELGGGKTLVVQVGDITALTSGETTLRLVTTATDQVKLVGTWTHGPDQTIDGTVWASYAAGGVTILVGGTGIVSTNATNDPGALDPFAGGELAPVPGYGGMDFTSPIEVVDRYELGGDLTIQSYETIRAGTTGVVFSDWGGYSLTNYGTVESLGSLMAWTIDANNIEQILNYGTIRADSSGGSAFAIYTDSTTSTENHGLITATAQVGDAKGVYTYNLLNLGTIQAQTTTGLAFGVSAWNGSHFENQGLISASSGGYYPGFLGTPAVALDLHNVSNAINSGTIIATAGKGLAKAINVYADFTTTLTNTGTIAAVSHAPDQFLDVPDTIAITANTFSSSSIFNLINSGEITGELHLVGRGTFTLDNSGVVAGAIRLDPFADYSLVTVRINNSGHITGDLQLVSQAGNSIQNSGAIDGAVTLGSGNDVFDGTLGTQGAVRGGGGNDVLKGGSGTDLLIGGSGTDSLTGGAGADIFGDTAAGLSGDTINDFVKDDRIIITDANLADFTFSISGNTLTFTGGSLTFGSAISGPIFASAVAGGGVQLSLVAPDVRNDFNGDGRSDILWRHGDGRIVDWLGASNGGFIDNPANSLTWVPTEWHVAGTGDFNGDGRDDILWRHDDGRIVDWLGASNGGFIDNPANSLTWVPTEWHVAGTGDFNGDGRDDILWRHDDGRMTDWLGAENGGFIDNPANALTWVPTEWHVAGTADFNGDGRDDILWRNDNGMMSEWLGASNGGFIDNVANASTFVPTDWNIVGTGDFNGDGRDDILWRNDDGRITNWLGLANGGFFDNASNGSTGVPTSWHVDQIGDFNGDGRDDILWRHDDGRMTNWLGLANGGFHDNAANAYTWVPTEWHVQVTDINLV